MLALLDRKSASEHHAFNQFVALFAKHKAIGGITFNRRNPLIKLTFFLKTEADIKAKIGIASPKTSSHASKCAKTASSVQFQEGIYPWHASEAA